MCRFARALSLLRLPYHRSPQIYPGGGLCRFARTRDLSSAGHLGDRRRVVHIHWGGGTPTIMLPRDFAGVMDALRRAFSVASDCEIAIEDRSAHAHSRGGLCLEGCRGHAGQCRRARLRAAGAKGGRPRAKLRADRPRSGLVARCWIFNINLDLMYGLPYQNGRSVAATARRSLALQPQSHCIVRLCPRPVDEAASEVAAGSGVTWRERALRARSGRGGRAKAS